MRRLDPLTPATAKGAAQDLLTDLVARNGTVGAMVSTMAHSPAVLGGYLQLSRAIKRARLDRRISERISIAVQTLLGCQLCLESHTAAAERLGIQADEIDRARSGTSADATVAPMVEFGVLVYRSPSSVTDGHLDRLRTLGYSDREIADVVGLVSLNVLTGTFNLVAGLEP